MVVCPQSLSIIEDLKTLQSEFDQLVAIASKSSGEVFQCTPQQT